jgi:hypothetical protein
MLLAQALRLRLGLLGQIAGRFVLPRRAVGAAGAVALRLDFCLATEWSVTARRADQEFRRDTFTRAHGPGSSLPTPRERFHRAFHTHGPSGEVLLPRSRTRRIPNLPSQAHPGLTCLGVDETASPAQRHPDPAARDQNGT